MLDFGVFWFSLSELLLIISAIGKKRDLEIIQKNLKVLIPIRVPKIISTRPLLCKFILLCVFCHQTGFSRFISGYLKNFSITKSLALVPITFEQLLRLIFNIVCEHEASVGPALKLRT